MLDTYGTIWVCRCCILTDATGECCADDTHGGDSIEPLSAIEAPFTVAMGMVFSEHSCGRELASEDAPLECDCETNTYSTSRCEGCGSWLHGGRYAMTLFKS